MKRIFISCIFSLLILPCFSQNLQLHYSPRHGLVPDDFAKNHLFSTVEMFRPDSWGSTFFFIDMTYDGDKGAVGSAYWEIARDLKFWDAPIAAHVEYNGGVFNGGSIPNAYLIGASTDRMLGNVFVGSYLAYKYNAFEKTSNDIQWTVTWEWTGVNNKLTACGFMDLWTENKNHTTGKDGKKWILLSQPQFWYNTTQHLSLGTEIEVSSRFYPQSNDVYVLPTIAAKWKF